MTLEQKIEQLLEEIKAAQNASGSDRLRKTLTETKRAQLTLIVGKARATTLVANLESDQQRSQRGNDVSRGGKSG